MSRGNDSNDTSSRSPSRTGRSKADRDNRSRQLNPNDVRYAQSRQGSDQSSGSWRERMRTEDAARIQSHADRTGRNQDFKERSQRAASRNEASDSDDS